MNPTPITAHDHLQTVIDHWHLLADMLDTHVSAPWPPSGRITDYLNSLTLADARQLARQPAGIRELEVGAGSAPLNLDALDAIRTTELALIGTADHIATVAQRYPITVDNGRGWNDELHLKAALIATQDQTDPRRWSLTNTASRTPAHAAVWLQQRLTGTPGPFRPLTTDQRTLVESVAREAGERVALALAILRRCTDLPYPCPHCHARRLTVQGGDGQAPAVSCGKCGRTWMDTPA
ncbi:hypothetical protein [Streptomyces sediminimaris]|uniref:hypothetical protein n=1 Tax=Streptomyces sediminimaris TaxID=3383721 RepID=UPI00399A76C9